MNSLRTSVRLLLICSLLVGTYAEYILEDLLAVETGSGGRRNVQQAGTPSLRSEGRLQKNTRAIEDRGNATSANGGNADKTASKDDDDEDKKTLAQQVADGKYGLIQKEIFMEPPQRPGIISYEVNPEVPKDNVNNLGGLKPEEIWLAENHLLVLAGGGRYDDNPVRNTNWSPIDDYRAPPRPVKIPPEPKVPPPFPIQLRPGGPTEFIRGVNGTGGPPPFPFFPPPGNFSGGIPTPFFGPPINIFQGNFTPGNGQIPPFPFPPPPFRNGSIPQLPFGPGPFPPPGFNFPPPPVNLTGQLDEDDPSIYYPPPYDFVYKRDNTTAVPPGPLVPGIVLPPPPDFFAPLVDDKRKVKLPKRPSPQKPTRPRPVISITTTPQPERPRYYYTTTKRPAVKIVTDDPSQQLDLNEVTPTTVEHALPPDAVVQGWVPIPAPRPFYITGVRKPPVKSRPLDERPRYVGGYNYEKPRDIYRVPNDEPQKWVDFNISRPAYVDESVYYRPTTTPLPYVPKSKAVKTFYFYDEPGRQVPTTAAPIPQTYYSTTRAPPRYYDAPRRPVSPLRYFYITEQPPSQQPSTIRPPVFEYSYTAPGYGTLEEPKLSGITTTVAPPSLAEYDSYYDYGPRVSSTSAPSIPAAYAEVTTPSPLRSTTIRPPKTETSTTRTPYILQTENPYHAYFTHQDYSLIDDITKKYFTIFGQKLNGELPTTPIPADVTRRPTTRVKFPNESPLEQTTPHAPYTSAYWSTPSPSPRPEGVYRYPHYSEYDYYEDGRGGDYGYQTVRDYYDVGNRQQQQQHSAALLQQPQLSYEGDTRVNTIRPYPTRDPDAEEFVRQKNNRYLTGSLKTQTAQSLRHDTQVNYVRPQRPVDPNAEEFDTNYQTYRQRPGQNTPYRGATDYNTIDPETRQRLILNLYKELLGRSQGLSQQHPPPSLVHDTRVNDQFIGQNVTPDPDAEVFNPAALNGRARSPNVDPAKTNADNSAGPFRQVQQFAADGRVPAGVIAYRLPGNGGGHFYFLTPQNAEQEEPKQNLYRRNSVRRRQSGSNDAKDSKVNDAPVKRNAGTEQSKVNHDDRTIKR